MEQRLWLKLEEVLMQALLLLLSLSSQLVSLQRLLSLQAWVAFSTHEASSA